jgi:uncharacterized protein YabE (DUF348 family)/3D (Asp-Asp-Asp) domain-containing protein
MENTHLRELVFLKPRGRSVIVQWAIALTAFMALCVIAYMYMEKTVKISVDDKTKQIHTMKSTVGDVMKEAGIHLQVQDKIYPPVQTELKDDMVIKVVRAFPVKIYADGQEKSLVSTPIKVTEALRLEGISLGEKDLVSAELGSVTYQDQVIRVTRVRESNIQIRTPIPYSRSYVSDQTLERGLTRTVHRGHQGLAQETVKVTYYDGKEVRREPLDKKIVKPAVNEVVAMGTITSISRGGLRLELERALVAVATAYTYTGHHTATGQIPSVGMAAVDPKVIPMGSRLYVEGYGFARASDIGSSIKGNKVDLFMEELSQCRRWGRKTVKVYILR